VEVNHDRVEIFEFGQDVAGGKGEWSWSVRAHEVLDPRLKVLAERTVGIHDLGTGVLLAEKRYGAGDEDRRKVPAGSQALEEDIQYRLLGDLDRNRLGAPQRMKPRSFRGQTSRFRIATREYDERERGTFFRVCQGSLQRHGRFQNRSLKRPHQPDRQVSLTLLVSERRLTDFRSFERFLFAVTIRAQHQGSASADLFEPEWDERFEVSQSLVERDHQA
jgi:hypothetical protein